MIDICVAPTFMRDYSKAGVGLQHLAEGCVKDLIRLATDLPTTWRRRYDRVEGLQAETTVLEIDVAGGPRLLAVDDNRVILWRLGDHGLINRVTRGNPSLPVDGDPLPPQFLPAVRSKLFPPDVAEVHVDYGAERTADWIYWLDDEQAEAGSRIAASIEQAILEERPVMEGLFGGPGTGKTTILVWLLKALTDLEPGGFDLDVRLVAPISVVNQIENSTGWRLDRFQLRLEDSYEAKSPDVILIDDPQSIADIDEVHARHPSSSLVFGFDPLQMGESITDATLHAWLDALGATAQWFGSCYRQKRVVGEASKHVADVVAASSPFLRSDKIDVYRDERSVLTEQANRVNFVNPSGRVATVLAPDWDEWESYWRTMYDLRRQGRLWNHWPPLLIIQDPEAEVPDNWLRRADSVATHRISTNELETVKGLEYQHVLLVLGHDLYSSLQDGFTGSGQAQYNRFRLFRIPFSRAKDSLVTFVFESRGR